MLTALQEFAQKHNVNGFRSIRVPSGHATDFRNGAPLLDMLLFADGSSWDDSWGVPEEPPEDPLALLRARRKYHAAWVSEGASHFESLHRALAGGFDRNGVIASYTWNAPMFGPQPPPVRDQFGEDTGENALQRLAEVHNEHLRQVKAIDAEIEAHPSIVRQRANAEANRAAAERAQVARDAEADRRRRRLARIKLEQ